MSEHLTEDFYYCKTNWLKEDNPTRVFRLKEVYEDADGVEYFVPMEDGVFITEEKHGDDAGNISVDCYMSQMRKADYKEIRHYVYDVYEGTENSMKLHDNSRRRISFYKEMRDKFESKIIFSKALKELDGFDERDIYHNDDRVLLNLLRSYYKCRVLEK